MVPVNIPQINGINEITKSVISKELYHFTLALFSIPLYFHDKVILDLENQLFNTEINQFEVDIIGFYSFQKMEACRVLYGKPSSYLELEGIKTILKNELKEMRERRILEVNNNLHMTIAKTTYGSEFDASHLKDNVNCGTALITEISLCKMGAVNGQYVKVLTFPLKPKHSICKLKTV